VGKELNPRPTEYEDCCYQLLRDLRSITCRTSEQIITRRLSGVSSSVELSRPAVDGYRTLELYSFMPYFKPGVYKSAEGERDRCWRHSMGRHGGVAVRDAVHSYASFTPTPRERSRYAWEYRLTFKYILNRKGR
jgi:hypothetical protein